MKIQLPAIKGVIGDWVYYQTALPFSEVVSRIDNDYKFREYKTLDDHLQRELSSRSKKISQYLLREETRFFNTAIIGLFGDRPQWYTFGFTKSVVPELSIPERIVHTIGILELSGEEVLFSIDGQHRIEGIKQALKKNPERFKLDELPLIIVAHNDDKKGKQRTRRLFSEINTKAVKVSGLDDLITNEDNPVHINARKLYTEYKPFNKEEFIALNHKTNIEPNQKEFTTILNLKEVNKILYASHYKHQDFRPSDKILDELYNISVEFWDEVVNNITTIKDVLIKRKKTVGDFRFKDDKKAGGSFLFRPIGLKILAQAYSQALAEGKKTGSLWKKINKADFSLTGKYWNNIAWDDVRKTMITPTRDGLLREYMFYLLGLKCDMDYLNIEYNKAFGITEKDKDKKELPEKLK